MTPHLRLARLLLTFACTCFAATLPAAEPTLSTPVSAAHRLEIEAMLQSLATALSAADEPVALASYDAADTVLLERTRREVQALSGRTALAVTLRLAQARGKADEVEAVVLRSIGFEDHQRPQMERRWQTMRLRRDSARWLILAEDEHEGMRTLSNDLSIELLPDQQAMRGRALLKVAITASGADSVLLELNRGLEITAITDERRRPVKFERTATSIEIRAPRALRSGERRVFDVAFTGSLFNESKEQGYSQVAITPAGSFASWVTSWYPRLTGNASKAKGTLQYLVPAGIKVASNGRLQSVTSSTSGDRYTFSVERPLDFSFAAARYRLHTARVDGVQVGIYLLSGDDRKVDLYSQGTERLLRLQRGFYGTYPFDGYAIVEIPSEQTGSLGGSSEQGMNFFPAGILGDRRFPLPLVAHEMGHSWWGNLVKSRGNAMLDEGLAQLSAVLGVLDFDGEAAMRRFVKEGYPQYGQSAYYYFNRFATPPGKDYPLGAAPTGADSSAALHDLADTKGMMVYSMLRDLIGQEALLEGLRDIVTRFADRSIALEDLRNALQKASGRNLDRFFQQWFFRTDAPELLLSSTTSTGESGYVISGTLTQVGEPYDLDVEIVLAGQQRKVTHTLHLEAASTSFSFASDFKPEWVVLDPQYKVLRWTAELRQQRLLKEGLVLTSLGKSAAAISKLEDYMARAPESLLGQARLAIALMEDQQLAKAEARLRRVLDYYASVQVYEPAVTLSELNLGRVLDLSGHRADALAAYERTLALPDEFDAHAAARAAVATPYTRPTRVAAPTRETLLRYLGDYDSGQGIVVNVTLSPLEVLQLNQPSGNPLLLEWIEGTRFRVTGSTERVLEFSGEPQAATLTLTAAGIPIKLQRRQ